MSLLLPEMHLSQWNEPANSFRAVLPPGEILFLSDVTAELDAARDAGMQTGLLLRPGNKPAEANGHPVYRSFDELS